MVNTELDWLEIRLNELKDHVDYFVILESKHTFTGLDKELIVKKNWKKFEEFHDKIILRVLDDAALESMRTWDHEDLQRNAMFDQVLTPLLSDVYPALTPAQTPSMEDVILVSDIDEIPKPSTLTLLRNCAFPIRLTLRSAFYYYSFQFVHRGSEWPHPQATVYRGNDTIRPADLRNGEGSYGGRNKVTLEWDKADLWNSSWHCSTCFSTLEETITKMDSFSHQGWNKPEFHAREHVVNCVRNGLDLFNRAGEFYDKISGRNWDIPRYLVETTEQSPKGWSWLDPSSYVTAIKGDKKPTVKGGEALKGGRFEYLLNRDPANGNFLDYSMVDAMSQVHEQGNVNDRLQVGPAGSEDAEAIGGGVQGGEAVGPEYVAIPGAAFPVAGVPSGGATEETPKVEESTGGS